jgi:hypothetical protein
VVCVLWSFIGSKSVLALQLTARFTVVAALLRSVLRMRIWLRRVIWKIKFQTVLRLMFLTYCVKQGIKLCRAYAHFLSACNFFHNRNFLTIMISFIWDRRRTKVYTNIAGKVVPIQRTEFQLCRLKINDIVEQETGTINFRCCLSSSCCRYLTTITTSFRSYLSYSCVPTFKCSRRNNPSTQQFL